MSPRATPLRNSAELTYFSPRLASNYSRKEFLRFLELIRVLQCSETLRDYVVNCIVERRFMFHASELVYLGTEYNIPVLLDRGFTRLCNIPLAKMNALYCSRLHPEVFAAYIYIITTLDQHRRMVAERPPPIKHSNDCGDLVGCTEDWRAVWWNGMGRLLLDAKNPCSYDDAVARFKTLRFGRVTEACKQYMFDNVIDTDVPAGHARTFIKCVKDRLIRKVIPSNTIV